MAANPTGVADCASPLRTLIYCALEWIAMAIFSVILMLAIGLFTDNVVNQALVVLSLYAFVLAGKLGGEW